MMKDSFISKIIFLAFFLVYMLVPILATYLFSIAVRWDRSIMPEGYTIEWYKNIIRHPYFISALRNSLLLATYTVIVDLVLIVPAAYIAYTRLHIVKIQMDLLTTLPFGIPRVILALAVITTFTMPLIARSPLLLVCACAVFSMPYMYRPVANSLEAIDLEMLNDAAQVEGANSWQILFYIIGPNILTGIVNGILLVFSAMFAEYTLAVLITGARFKTLPMLLVEFTRRDGRIASAIAVVAFTVAMILSLLIILVTRERKSTKIKQRA